VNTVTARRLDGLLQPFARALSEGRPAPAPCRPDSVPVLAGPPGAPVVVVKLVGLGSLVLLAPALEAFARRSGRPVFLVTVAASRSLLSLLDWDVTPVYLRSECVPLLAWDVVRQAQRLRRLHPAAVVDLEFHSAFTTLFGHTLQPRRHLLLDDPGRRGLATDTVIHAADMHFADLARGVLSALAGVDLPAGLALPLRPDALPPPSPRPSGRRRVVVNVNTGIMCLERRLPLAVFGDLLPALASAVDAEFHLIGDHRERAYTARFAAALPTGLAVTNHAGQLDIRGLLGLLRTADLVISNDTGPMHLAATLGTPTLAIFGPESPARFGPRGSRSTVVWGRIPCGPCLTVENRKTAPCRGDNRCLQQLTAADLLAPALDLLAGGSGGTRSVGPRLDPPALAVQRPGRSGG
jgi:ADP-heptose:LPS heptosyltransferase